MKIKELKIKDFKGISLLDYKPKSINLIIGRNNTGKTTLLESIYLSFNLYGIKQRYSKYLLNIIKSGSEYSEITAITENIKINIKIRKADEIETIYALKKDWIDTFFKNLPNINKNIEITKNIKEELENILIDFIDSESKSLLTNESIVITKDDKDKKVYYRIDKMSKLDPLLEKILNCLKKKFNLKNSDIEMGSPLSYFLFYPPSMLITSDKKEVFLISDLLRQTIIASKEEGQEKAERIAEIEKIIKEYNLIDDLERLDFDYVIFRNGANKKVVPFQFLGDGFKALVGLLWSFSLKDVANKVLLLDEPELHMHPGYIKDLVKIIIKFSKELNIQLFIVTHNCDFIEEIFNEDLSKEEKDYLEKELLTLKMEQIKDYTTPEALNYRDAKYTKEKLLLDLRGR